LVGLEHDEAAQEQDEGTARAGRPRGVASRAERRSRRAAGRAPLRVPRPGRAEPLKPLARWAEVELAELLADKGDGVTAAERAVLEDVARLGGDSARRVRVTRPLRPA
jgi:hypothetical protein